MIIIKNYDNLLLEKYGRNKISHLISNKIVDTININLGKLILNKSLILDSTLDIISDINFINDKINIKLSNRTYGNINTSSLILKEGIIENLIINLELNLSFSEFGSKSLLDNKVKSVIEHECLHLIERYITVSNNYDFSKSWDKGEILYKLQNKYSNSENWIEISHFIYLSLPHEQRARLQQLNKEVEDKHINGILDVQNYIKTTKIYKDVDFLSNIDINLVFSKIVKDDNYSNLLSDFSILFLENKNKDYSNNFKDYLKVIKSKNTKLLKKLLKISYNFESFNLDDKVIKYKDFK